MDYVTQIVLGLMTLIVSVVNLVILVTNSPRVFAENEVEVPRVLKKKPRILSDSKKRRPVTADDFHAWAREQEEIKNRTPL